MRERDLDFARRDLELEKAKYRSFAGSEERGRIDADIKEHHTKKGFYLFDDDYDAPAPEPRNDDESRIREFNKMLDEKLRQAQ